jgi:hypothetical protein
VGHPAGYFKHMWIAVDGPLWTPLRRSFMQARNVLAEVPGPHDEASDELGKEELPMGFTLLRNLLHDALANLDGVEVPIIGCEPCCGIGPLTELFGLQRKFEYVTSQAFDIEAKYQALYPELALKKDAANFGAIEGDITTFSLDKLQQSAFLELRG